jgi:hypothetical protein
MKYEINSKSGSILPDVLLSVAFEKIYKEIFQEDSIVQVLMKITGNTGLSVILNNKIINPDSFSKIHLAEGDDLRIQHPYFGG